jgi:hypothetical protein
VQPGDTFIEDGDVEDGARCGLARLVGLLTRLVVAAQVEFESKT